MSSRQHAGQEWPLLLERLQELRGDPRLTAWEEQFITDCARSLETYGPRTAFSAKQAATLAEIETRLAARPARQEADTNDEDDEP